MSERVFRLILGGVLLLFLLLDRLDLIYLYIGVIVFEGLTNWRIPLLVSRLRFGKASHHAVATIPLGAKYNFDAERALRLVIAALLLISLFIFPKTLWFFPWLVGFALVMAGITGICPMAIFMKKLGFK